MQQSYWGYWLILLGIFVVVVMMLIQSATTGNTQDYLMMKEVTQAAMVDSVDFAYYRMYGEVKMNKEKFVENFIRRFSENVNISTNYNVKFYDLYEVPPKVTVRVSSKTNTMNVGNTSSSFDIVNDISAILEFGYSKDAGDKSSAKKACTLYMMPALKDELKAYLESIGDKDTADKINNLDDAKKVFASVFSGYAAMSWEQLRTTYPKINEWLNNGILLESM